MAEKKAVEEEMEEFVKLHEGEINALLIEYWTMRKQAGELARVDKARSVTDDCRGLHEHCDGQVGIGDQSIVLDSVRLHPFVTMCWMYNMSVILRPGQTLHI